MSHLQKERELFLDATKDESVEIKDHHETERIMASLEQDNQLAVIHIEELEGIVSMRRTWSTWLLSAIMLVVIFDIFLILAIGTGFLTFEANYFVPVFVSESLLKIFGLAVIVVKFLFNEDAIR